LQFAIAKRIANCNSCQRRSFVAEGEREVLDGGLRLIRSDTLLARYLFGNPAQRRVIPALQADGWPIWAMAGKRAARSSDLDAEAAERARAARRNGRGQHRAVETKQILAQMRERNVMLHRICRPARVIWRLSTGEFIPAEIAIDLLNNENVVGTGDFLLGGLELSQTFRWRAP
jgi:hypothetical protein